METIKSFILDAAVLLVFVMLFIILWGLSLYGMNYVTQVLELVVPPEYLAFIAAAICLLITYYYFRIYMETLDF